MANKVVGNINVGLLLGLGQFVSRRSPSRSSTSAGPTGSSTRPPSACAPRSRETAHDRARLGAGPAGNRHQVGNPAVNIAIFALFVVVTLGIVIRASRNNKTAADFYAGGRVVHRAAERHRDLRRLPVGRVSFLGIAGAIAINGYDGFLYSIGFLVAWLVALLLVAELLRNTGRFTMADVLSFRLQAAAGPDGGGDLDARRSASSTCWRRWPAPGGLVALLLGHRRPRPGRAS